ncbi:MAG: polysaccharide deacetylase family protein [Pseudolabrys sp.]|nr:polysaccharide deacetylase family protein [Pseudolabrys sp.]
MAGLISQRRLCVVAIVASVFFSGGAASAAATTTCPGNSDALGVSRTLVVNARDYVRLGRMQYRESLPLDDHEVVLTFDDGPIPPYTDRVLEILAHECVKATFFLVGRHVAANPAAARRVLAAGHTIGNHSQNHSLRFNRLAETRAEDEVENGYQTITAALGADTVAPFFRVPGLNRTSAIEAYAHSHDLVVWSSDTLADDWTRISANQVLKRALSRLEARGKGILLLHDIQPRTVLMLPALLAELKRRHFRIVHVVPERTKEPTPAEVIVEMPDKLGWPRIVATAMPVGDPAEPVEAALSAEIIPLPPERAIARLLRHRRVGKPTSTGAVAHTGPMLNSAAY